jgi:hypothetical protein
METKLNIGDQVKITDGSYAVRVDKYEKITSIGLCKDVFVVTSKTDTSLSSYDHRVVHDIFIENVRTGKMYLHTSRFVSVVAPKVLEIKISDLEKEHGCKVKIIK